MCYFNGKLYITRKSREAGVIQFSLDVHSVIDQDTIKLLDTLHLDVENESHLHLSPPRVDRQSGNVYIACDTHGVYVVKYVDSKLVAVRRLTCVARPSSLAVVSPDTLYVCDRDSATICLVDVSHNRVTARLQNEFEDRENPRLVAFLGDTVFAQCSDNLAIYRHGVPAPRKVIPGQTRGQGWVVGLNIDHHSSCLLVTHYPDDVYVMDLTGNLAHTIRVPIDMDSQPVDCTVVGEQLWVGYPGGEIIVMSSQ